MNEKDDMVKYGVSEDELDMEKTAGREKDKPKERKGSIHLKYPNKKHQQKNIAVKTRQS